MICKKSTALSGRLSCAINCVLSGCSGAEAIICSSKLRCKLVFQQKANV
ncbi:hypothetical protein HMPREF0868_0565 [Mageeibacillus indolicus UPII9-5]|uniref:Lipoprotein n=1 Tax=Mageeibacillus indolicus (strain UPII9-5) TaxID=699246 RepID=D3R131_MAGIU|nr:hypothetical protein HMPREF0868_0565 [Mageeibacillus indolicus UPII9-5]